MSFIYSVQFMKSDGNGRKTQKKKELNKINTRLVSLPSIKRRPTVFSPLGDQKTSRTFPSEERKLS